jgi:hypothetical protein
VFKYKFLLWKALSSFPTTCFGLTGHLQVWLGKVAAVAAMRLFLVSACDGRTKLHNHGSAGTHREATYKTVKKNHPYTKPAADAGNNRIAAIAPTLPVRT